MSPHQLTGINFEVIMHRAFLFLCCSALVAGDLTRLHQLAGANRLFELRRDLEEPGWNDAETLFYRAIVQCRFGRETSGIEMLERVLKTEGSSAMARKSHEEMAAAFQRIGRYKDAAREAAEALRLTRLPVGF